MQDIIVHPDPARDARARALVPQVPTWPKYTLRQQWGAFDAGTVFRRARGSKGERYLVNAVACQCADYQQAGNVCKHIRAWRLEAEAAREAACRPRVTIEELLDQHLVDAF